MGKFEEDQFYLPSTSSSTGENAIVRRRPYANLLFQCVGFRCVIVVVFSVAVLLSTLFWLPPFSRFGHRSDLDLDSLIRAHEVVASFVLPRQVGMLKSNIQQLELDIFDELAVPNSTVEVIYLESIKESNTSSVVFALVPDSNSIYIPSASLSLLRASILSLVLRQSSLRLTSSLFGDPFLFEVLKFPGGITVIPQQTAFLLQKQTFFTFTLNFSIYQLQQNFEKLKNQLEAGLQLTVYENVYVGLSNKEGSTVAPPTSVQAAVLQTIGNHPPPLKRLKQLARTITSHHARNLGLNHTVFGKVKQVRLSSAMQQSIDSGGSGPPSAAPSPHSSHHHHHHHHQHHHRDLHFGPSPAPVKSYRAEPPPGCQNGFTHKVKKQVHVTPAIAPVVSPCHAAVSHHSDVAKPPAPSSHFPAPSPLPTVVFTRKHSPNMGTDAVEAPNMAPSPSPLPSSSVGISVRWQVGILLLMVVHIL